MACLIQRVEMALLVKIGKVKQPIESADGELPTVGRAGLGLVLAIHEQSPVVTSVRCVRYLVFWLPEEWISRQCFGSLQPLT